MDSSQNEALCVWENPFFHRGPIEIQNRRYFFGRTRETRRALQMLRNGQCISIIGPRRIGKTSLLSHLCDSEVQKRYDIGGEYLFVYINCEGLGDLDKSGFYQWLWKETNRTLLGPEEADQQSKRISGFSEFRDAMITIRREGHKPTLLLDEFEGIAQNPNFDQHLFSDLRSLVPDVAYVTASQDSLFDLTYADMSVLSSPFFNIFREIHLGFLEQNETEGKPHEAEEMISGLLKMAKQEDLFTKDDCDVVFSVGGFHPFFLQMACSHLFEQKMRHKELTAADYESVRQQYEAEAEAHFRYIWDNLDPDERKAVRLVCRGKVSRLKDEQKRRLGKKCILYKDAIFSSSFAEFVRRLNAAVNHRGPARAILPTRLPRQKVDTIRVAALLATFGLIIGWFGVRVSSPVAVFLACGLLLLALGLLVSNWSRRAP